MKVSRSAFIWGASAAVAIGILPATAMAASKSFAYFKAGADSRTFLVDWQPKHQARVTNNKGSQPGTVSDDGTQKLITLAGPLRLSYAASDECGMEITQNEDTNQVVVRDLPGGISEIVEIGVVTNVGGCQDGLSVPFGSPSDPGASLDRLSMAARSPMSDVLPGAQFAGLSEDLDPEGYGYFAEDVVTVQAGNAVVFQATGHTVPAVLDASQWLVLSLAGQQRAYTRLAPVGKTGGDMWLMADWSGSPTRIEKKFVVKPLAGAGFGTKAQASRMWESGLFIASRRPFEIDLYRNGSGERVQRNLDQGTELRTPIDGWGFLSGNLVMHRSIADGAIWFDRTWVPLRNEGKAHWVMESEFIGDDAGQYVNIKPRVNYYLDKGKAVPPTQAARKPGRVNLGERSNLQP